MHKESTNDSELSVKRVIGLDAHPDICVAQKTERSGRRIRKVGKAITFDTPELAEWCREHVQPGDLIVLEASGNSFAIAEVIKKCGFAVQVLDSAAVNAQKVKNDNDHVAALRIAKYWWNTDEVRVVWQPDEKSRIMRTVLLRYLDSVREKTRRKNKILSFLNGYGIRLKGISEARLRNCQTRMDLLKRIPSPLERELLQELFGSYDLAIAAHKRHFAHIRKMAHKDKRVLACMRIPGIGVINAFALVAIIGDITRFASPKKLASYIGLTPQSHQSGNGKEKKWGLCGTGRSDLRALLVEAANHVLYISRKDTKMRKWALSLMMRKEHKGTILVAIARKLCHYAWYALSGRPITEEENSLLTIFKARGLVTDITKEELRELGYKSKQQMLQAMAERIRTIVLPSTANPTGQP